MNRNFEFNEKGCCKNPATEIVYQDGKYYVCIAFAQKGKRWAMGFRYVDGSATGGGVREVCFKRPSKTFSSEGDAKRTAVLHITKMLKCQDNKDLAPVIKKLEDWFVDFEFNIA